MYGRPVSPLAPHRPGDQIQAMVRRVLSIQLCADCFLSLQGDSTRIGDKLSRLRPTCGCHSGDKRTASGNVGYTSTAEAGVSMIIGDINTGFGSSSIAGDSAARLTVGRQHRLRRLERSTRCAPVPGTPRAPHRPRRRDALHDPRQTRLGRDNDTITIGASADGGTALADVSGGDNTTASNDIAVSLSFGLARRLGRGRLGTRPADGGPMFPKTRQSLT